MTAPVPGARLGSVPIHAGSGVPRQNPLAGLLRHHLTSQLSLAVWFWGIAIVIAGIVVVLIDRFGEVEHSVIQWARQGAIWFPFSLMVILVASYLATHVAAGLTRRVFAHATLSVAALSGLLHAVVLTVLLQVERGIYVSKGWTQTLDGMPLIDVSDQVGRLLVAYLLTTTAATVSGLLVGIVYYRLGGWWGTIALPLTVGPLLLVAGLLSGDAGPIDLRWLRGLGVLGAAESAFTLRCGLGVILVGGMAEAYRRLVQHTDINPVTS